MTRLHARRHSALCQPVYHRVAMSRLRVWLVVVAICAGACTTSAPPKQAAPPTQTPVSIVPPPPSTEVGNAPEPVDTRRAGAQHTNAARTLKDQALAENDAAKQRELVEKSILEFRAAREAWLSYLLHHRSAPDAYYCAYWLSDAEFWVTVLPTALGRAPPPEQIKAAREALRDIRDAGPGAYQEASAQQLVNLEERLLADEQQLYTDSAGQKGLEKLLAPRTPEETGAQKYVTQPLPTPVLEFVHAVEHYIAIVPVNKDPQHLRASWAFAAADLYFVYGHMKEAKAGFQRLREQSCEQVEWSDKAWQRLRAISLLEGDSAETRKLDAHKACNAGAYAASQSARSPLTQP
jgi:hypothetical protein